MKLQVKRITIPVPVFILLIALSLFLGYLSSNLVTPREFPGGGFYTYKYIPRKLTLSSFKDINVGDSYTSIKEKVGEPSGEYGSGWIRPYYQLADGTCIMMWFDYDDDGEYGTLSYFGIIDVNGRGFILEED